MKNALKKILVFSIIATLVINCLGFEKKVRAIETDTLGDCYCLDSHLDDGAPSLLDRDDFISYDEYIKFSEEHPDMVVPSNSETEAMRSTVPIDVPATLKYTIKGLTATTAVQTACIANGYLFITQREGSNTRLSRCTINETTKEATVSDYMTLTNFGHGQTLDYIGNNSAGSPRFIIGCKANSSYYEPGPDNTNVCYNWSLQIGRLTYSAGTTVSYTDIPRLAGITYANKNNTAYGTAKRVDAAVSDDLTKLVIWMKNTVGDVQYSVYNLGLINNLFNTLENQNVKYAYCYDSSVTNCFLGSCQQISTSAYMPNGSFQGIEIANDLTLKISGGHEGDIPKIAYITGSINSSTKTYSLSWIYNASVTNTTNFSGQALEIEGLQLYGIYTNCVIRDTGYTRNTGKYRVYSIANSSFTS